MVTADFSVREEGGVERNDVIDRVALGRVDGEVQRHHGVATHCVDECVGRLVCAGGVSHTVDPGVAVARHLLVNAGGGLADGELQSINARTVVVVVVTVVVVVVFGFDVTAVVVTAGSLSSASNL